MTQKRVVITGLGIICPLGHNTNLAWDAAIDGTSGVGPITLFDASSLKTQFAAEVKDFDAKAFLGAREARRSDRFTQLALVAAAEAINDSQLDLSHGPHYRIGVVLGSGIGGVETLSGGAAQLATEGAQWISPHMVPMMLPDTAPAKIAIEYGLRGPNMSIATACASSNNAIGEAAAMIQRGAADIMITGGAEAGIVELAMAGFSNMGALSQRNDNPQGASRPFDKDRDGFVAGEGAAILVLESEEHALARDAKIYAEILGYGASADAYHITAPEENAEGAIYAMKTALNMAGVTPQQVDYINAHGTSTTLNDKAETHAIKTVLGQHAYMVAISSTKSMTGHLLGAAGAIEALFCVKAIETNTIPPTINYETPDPDCDLNYTPNEAKEIDVKITLSNSFGFGGHNACLVVGRYNDGARDES